MPDTTTDQIVSTFTATMRASLAKGLHKIEHCASQLTDEQFWWRPREDMNSIANLLLHLAGNLRQWAVSGVNDSADTRNRPREFSDRSGRSKAELLKILRDVIGEVEAALATLTAEQLVAARRIQGYDVNVASAVLNTVCHFQGHVQEIIHITREQLGAKYRFDFVPQGAEQESAAGPGI
ncbi:MAG TPA: DUF1572 family protein [Planctomycetaceae bacterium]|nr:DUF1572 family protein [Planctomycetaceae bacterium]